MEPLLAASGGMAPGMAPASRYRQTRWRWWVLGLFVLSNCNQCLCWFSFNSTDSGAMRTFFGHRMDKTTLDLFLNWGPIVGVAVFPLQTWLLSRRHGLQRGTAQSWAVLHYVPPAGGGQALGRR